MVFVIFVGKHGEWSLLSHSVGKQGN